MNIEKKWRSWTFLALIVFFTFVFHLLYGVWFWTSSPTNAPKTSLRLAGDAYLASYPTWDTDHERDAAFYNRGAMGILHTGVPRTRAGLFQDHAPVYAYFLAFCYKLGGIRWLAVIVPQAVLSALTSFLLGLAAIRLAPRRAALAGAVASVLVLIDVPLAAHVGYLDPTTLVLFFFALAVWSAVSPGEAGLKPVFFAAMILAIYTQAAFFVIGFATVVWMLWLFYRHRSPALLVGACCVLAFASAKPLIGMVIDRSAEIRSEQPPSFVLWEANNPCYESMSVFSLWERRWTRWKATDEETRRYDEYLKRADGNTTKAALLWIRENPAKYLVLCVVRFKSLLGPITGQMSPLNRKISTVLWLLVFPPGFYALWKHRHARLALLACYVILFEFTFETLVITEWQLRYRLPVTLLLMVFAALFYAELAGHWFGGGRKARPSVETGPPA